MCRLDLIDERAELTRDSHGMEYEKLMETGMYQSVLMDERVGLTCCSHGRAHERPINEVLVMEKLMGKGGVSKT